MGDVGGCFKTKVGEAGMVDKSLTTRAYYKCLDTVGGPLEVIVTYDGPYLYLEVAVETEDEYAKTLVPWYQIPELISALCEAKTEMERLGAK